MDRSSLPPYDEKLEKLDWELYDICHAADKFQNMKDIDSRLWQAAEATLKEMRELCVKGSKEIADIQAVLNSQDLQNLGAGNPCFQIALDKQLTLVQQVERLKNAYVKQVVEVSDPVKEHLKQVSEATYLRLKDQMDRNELVITSVVNEIKKGGGDLSTEVNTLRTENGDLRKRLNALDETNKDMITEIGELRKMKEALTDEKNRIRSQYEQLMNRINNFAENASSIKISARTLDENSKLLADHVTAGEASQKSFQTDLETVKAQNKKLEDTVTSLQKQIAELESQLKQWDNFISKNWYEALQEAVKKCNKAAVDLQVISTSSGNDVKEAKEKYRTHTEEMQKEVKRLHDLVEALRRSFQILGRRLDQG